MRTDDIRATARRTLVVIGVTLAAAVVLLLAYLTRRVLAWVGLAVFVSVALDPVVSWLERRAAWLRRSVATLLVYLAVVALLSALAAAVAAPLTRQLAQLVDHFPHLLQQVRQGDGPLGHLLARARVLDYLVRHEHQVRAAIGRIVGPASSILLGAASAVFGTITVFVLSFLMVVQAPRVKAAVLDRAPPAQREWVRGVGIRCAHAVTGYVSGNLLISLIAGALSWVALALLDVPYSSLLALLVALLDLLPLVGATVGAVIACSAAFLRSTSAGVIMIVFFVVYQQFENHLLQPLIMSRAVQLSPLTVLIVVLVAAELGGILGALVAMPVASILRTIGCEVWANRRALRPGPRTRWPPRPGEGGPPHGTNERGG
ncbi:AI-2E family transporter [Rhizomonospora bruguierae]|uniref:AI-2E family transporter n=1 Tax=Rhizomonospora bruguierae TaxID=1581705 RepID=UPI001BCD94B4|nr:AI-2E family transporter [Micromonospora sp. NBRC 107566]